VPTQPQVQASQASTATPSGPLAQTLTGQAKADYDAGKLLYGDGDFNGALIKFEAAFDASRDGRLLWNVGACEKALRHYARAVLMLNYYIRAPGLTDQDRKDANDMIQALQPFVAQAQLNVSEQGASVYVDDALVGTTPLKDPLLVDIGGHKIRVTKDGFKEFSTTVTISGSGNVPIEAKLEKDIHEGKLAIRAGANDTIQIDGKVVGTGQWEGPLPSGGHMLRVTAPGMRALQTEIVVQDNQTRGMSVQLEKETAAGGGGIPAWVWIGGGVLVAGGAAVGGYLLLKPSTTTSQPPQGSMGTVALASFR
jgi:hypothetical protein